jgi:hypothetical protein
MTDEPAELTIPGVRAKSLGERAAEEFARLGGPMMPERIGEAYPPEFMEKYRADGGAREDAGANAWRAARDQALNEVHLMLRFLCRSRLIAVPEQLDPGFLMKLVTAIEPDDRTLYMNVEHEGRRANRHVITFGAVKALAWYALANLPQPFVAPPPVMNSERDQLVAAQARREAFALLKGLVYERLGMKTGMVPRVIELIDDAAAQPYTWKRSTDENHG